MCKFKGAINWGFINRRGEVVIKPKYLFVQDFHDGLARYGAFGSEGVIDKKGNKVLKKEYLSISRGFYGDLFYQKEIDGKRIYGYMDSKGNTIIEATGRYECMQLSENKFIYRKNKYEWAIVDRNKNELAVINADHIYPQRFEKLISIIKDKKWGFADENGKVLVQPRFDCLGGGCPSNNEAIYLAKEIIVAYQNGKMGLVNNKGNIILEPQFDDIGRFVEGLAPYKDGNKYGLMNIKGIIITKPRFDSIFHFDDGYARAKINGQSCIIDKKGKIILGPDEDKKFKWLFDNELVVFEKGKKEGVINFQGEVVIDPIYYGITSIKNGKAKVYLGDIGDSKEGYIDKKGKYVIEPIYDDIFELEEKSDLF